MRQQHHRRGEPAAADVAGLPGALGQVCGQRGGERTAAYGAARVVPPVRAHQDQRLVVGDAGGRVGDDVHELGLGGEQPGPEGLVPRTAVDAEPAPLHRTNVPPRPAHEQHAPDSPRAQVSSATAAARSNPDPASTKRSHGPGCSTRNQWSAGGAVPSSRSPAASAASAHRGPGVAEIGVVTSARRAPRHPRAAAGAPARSGRPPPSPAGYPLRRGPAAAACAQPPR